MEKEKTQQFREEGGGGGGKITESMEESEALREKGDPGEAEDWVQRALSDDRLAAEVLMVFSVPARDLTLDVARHSVQWSRRLPRSRQIDLAGIRKAKEEEEEKTHDNDNPSPPRGSPLSPLSWSGGSGGGGDSDYPKNPSENPPAGPSSSDKRKSKVDASETKQPRRTSTGGRAKKKKDAELEVEEEENKLLENADLHKKLAELKEEENKLLLENADLHKRVEELNTTYNELISAHLSLQEKIKVNMESQPPKTGSSSSSHMGLPRTSSSKVAVASPERVVVEVPASLSLKGASYSSPWNARFQVPDLNEEPKPES